MRSESWNPLLRSYPDSEKINAASIGAETLYTRLLAQSDDAAHYYGDPKWIMAKLFTARMLAGQVDEKAVGTWIDELEHVGLIVRYRAEGGTYLELVNCKKCLRRDVKAEIRFPARPASVTDSARTRNESGPLDPDPDPYIDPEKTHTAHAAHASGSEPAASSPDLVALIFPIKGGGEWELRQAKVDEYAATFQGIDVPAQLRQARQWCIDNPAKRKTAKGMPAFLSGWLGRTNKFNQKGSTNGQRKTAAERGEFPEQDFTALADSLTQRHIAGGT